MSRLLFLQNIDYEFLGPMYISAMAEEGGHQVRLALGQTLEEFAPTIESFRPDLVAFSIMSGSHQWARDMATRVKDAYGIPNLFGGAHPTFFPQFAEESGVDYLVRGEGEETTRELLDAFDTGAPIEEIPNLWFRKDGDMIKNPVRKLRRNLDDYPYPDRNLYNELEKRLDRTVRNVITSRGCPWHCSFCFEDAMRDLYEGKGKYVRIREIDKVIDECKRLRDETDVRIIYFADDVFGMSKKWLYEFLPIYKKEVGLEFVCLVRADMVASDDEYAFRLAEGGCRSVFFGVESGNEELRNKVLSKALSDEQIIRAADLLHRAGIKFRAYNIVGLPDETLEDAISTVELNIKIGTDYPWCSIFSPFPGTALTAYAAERGYLKQDFEVEQLSKSFFLKSDLDMKDIKRIENLQKFFQTVVLFPRTLPLVKLLIRLRPNRLFDWWFGLIYFWVYIKSERRNFLATLRFAFRNFRHVLAKQ